MKKVLITGATGFVGSHLIDHLQSIGGYEIIGTTLPSSKNENKQSIQLEKIDLAIYDDVYALIARLKPDFIYHLAAFTSPADSFNNPSSAVLGNMQIQLNVLNAVKEHELNNTRMLAVSSAEVYGLVDETDLPIAEKTDLNPLNPYAVSKIAQDYLALQYSLAYKLDIVRVRPFNHTGPGQSPNFVIPSFAKQIAEIEKGLQEPVLRVGNLNAKRDFTDVRDIVRGYVFLMDRGKKGDVYNIGSGKSHSTKELLDMMLSMCDKKIVIEEDPSKMRPIEVANVYCDYSKINSLTSWKPEIQIEKTLQDTLDYWRSVV